MAKKIRAKLTASAQTALASAQAREELYRIAAKLDELDELGTAEMNWETAGTAGALLADLRQIADRVHGTGEYAN